MNFKKLLFFCFLIIGCATSNYSTAQVHDLVRYEGYVVQNNNDTIYGKLRLNSPVYNQLFVHLITESGIRKWKVEDLKSYSYQHSNGKTITHRKFYVTRPCIEFGSHQVLLKESVKGKVSLYYYFIENDNDVNIPITKVSYIQIRNSTLFEVNRSNYFKILEEHYDLSAFKHGNAKKYSFKKLPLIIQAINNKKI